MDLLDERDISWKYCAPSAGAICTGLLILRASMMVAGRLG